MGKVLHSYSPYARGRKEFSSDAGRMSDLWIPVQVSCSSTTAAGMVYSSKGDEINCEKVQAQGIQTFLQ